MRGASSHSAGLGGSKALYLLLKRAGLSVSRLESSLPTTLAGRSGLLVILNPVEDPSENDGELLVRWVEKGNTLLIAARESAPYLRRLGWSLQRRWAKTEDIYIKDSPFTRDVGRIDPGLPFSSRIFRTANPDGLMCGDAILIGDPAGVLASVKTIGDGKAVLITCPEIFRNLYIGRADNAVLAVRLAETLAQGGAVFFDEYHQSTHESHEEARGALSLITPEGKIFALALLIALAMLIHSAGKRFGSPIPERVERERYSTEYVASMASLYRKGGATGPILESLLDNFKHEIRRDLHLTHVTEDGALAALIGERTGISPQRFLRLISESKDASSKEGLSEKEVLGFARAFDRLRKEILGRG
jgi:hypothetical protein